MARIDAHHHVWDIQHRDQAWAVGLPELYRTFDLQELIPQLEGAWIDRTVVVQTVTVAEETPELLTLAARWPQIAGVVGWVDLEAPSVGDRLSALAESPGGDRLVSIRHQVQEEPDHRYLDRPAVRRGIATVARQGLAYDLVVIEPQWEATLAVVRDLPDVTFVLDHAGKPPIRDDRPEPWRRWITELAAQPNVAVKLSGLLAEAGVGWTADTLRPYAEHLLAEFGSSRVMYGSDWPVSLLAAGYRDVAELSRELIAGASPAELHDVFGATATRWYGLDA